MLGSINGTSLSVNIKTMQFRFTISETDTQVLGVANKYTHYIVSLFIINFLKQNNYFFIFSIELLIFFLILCAYMSSGNISVHNIHNMLTMSMVATECRSGC